MSKDFGIKKNFGFGCMRLPMIGEEVDHEQVKKMVDEFLAAGFNYFDTAHGYINEKSEIAVRECLAKRYPRESYILTNKLSNSYFNSQEEIRPFLEKQLEACGVEYFDFYLMHAQNTASFEKYKACRAYETAFELKKEGKVKHVGLSFHDSAEVLDRILTEYPDVEVVQIQFNYVDYEDATVESRKCYEVCRKHQKPVIVMEPVKGGSLVNLPDEAKALFDELGGGSYASYALRYVAGFEGMMMTLSGMSNTEQMNDNINTMKDFVPLSAEEHAVIDKVRDIIRSKELVKCTACRYCTDGCPKHIAIPDLFSALNEKILKMESADAAYKKHTENGGKASDCIKCGKCEQICPQKLRIRRLLRNVAAAFDEG